MRLVQTFLYNLARVVLAAELSTRHSFRGYSRNDEHLLELAHSMISDRAGTSRHARGEAEDALVIAEAVWWDYTRPHVKKMLVEKWCASDEDAEKTIDAYFVDDSPRWHPELDKARERNKRG